MRNICFIFFTIILVSSKFSFADQPKCATLKVAYVENPRFTPISSSELKSALHGARTEFLKLLNHCVDFNEPKLEKIADVFGSLSDQQKKSIAGLIVREPTTEVKAALTQLMASSLNREKSSLREQLAYTNKSLLQNSN